MKYIVGSDECGYGAWAGPLVVCAVSVPVAWVPPIGLNDSKRLDEWERMRVYKQLMDDADHVRSVLLAVDNRTIDRVGLGVANKAAHVQAVTALRAEFPDSEVIVDGNLKLPIPWARSIPKADTLYPAVMAASIIAKINRDNVMRSFHRQYPDYGWDTNVGYGTEKHEAGLRQHGVTPLHRRSYRPIRKLLETTT